MGYVVIAPYVTLYCTDANGVPVVRGFYAGAAVPETVTAESLKHHLDSAMIAEAEQPAKAEEPTKPTAAKAEARAEAAKAKAE